MRCKTCGGRDLEVVGFKSANGATYTYCRWCETGSWDDNGGAELATHEILQAASAIEPSTRGSVRFH